MEGTEMANAGNSFENDGLPLSYQQRRVRERELWMAMQEAHKRWMHATDVLNSLVLSSAGATVSPEESVRIAKSAEEQRLGFEEYIEARLEYSEFLLAREPEAGTGPDAGEDARRPPLEFPQNWWTSATTSKRGLLAVAVALLCPAVFGLTFMHERKHVQELETAREAMNAMMVQVRSVPVQAQAPERKPDAASAPLPVALQPDGTGPVVKLYQPPVPVPVRAPARAAVPPRSVEFLLASSTRYRAVGPIRVSLHNVDYRRDCFDLSVKLGDFQMDRKRVKRYEPVWINLGGNSAPVRLIADRIGKNGVHGYLTRPQPKGAASSTQRMKNAGTTARGKSPVEARVLRPQNGT